MTLLTGYIFPALMVFLIGFASGVVITMISIFVYVTWQRLKQADAQDMELAE